MCLYIINYVGGGKFKACAKKEVFGEPTLCDFEGVQVYGPQDPDAYLRGIYGDYMQLPPEDKRVTNHYFVCLDFDKGYLDKE